MALPSLYSISTGKSIQTAFGGLNESYACAEAEFTEMKNFSSRGYPALQTRTPRRTMRAMGRCNGMYHLNGLLLCEGTTVIRNAQRLRLKESDRIAAMEAELRACGGVLESDGGTITVHGCAEHLHAPEGILHGHNDHRVVMSLAVLAAAAALPLTVDDAEAIQKSWPGFFADAAPLGVEVEDA